MWPPFLARDLASGLMAVISEDKALPLQQAANERSQGLMRLAA